MTAQSVTDFSYMDTPEFKAKADALIKAEQDKYDAWLADDNFEALIAGAKIEAMDAYKAASDLPEEDAERSTWIEIDFGHRRAYPIIQALNEANIGFAEIAAWAWYINSEHVLGKRRRGHYGTARQNCAAVDAFAMALSRPGFELKIMREQRF